MAPTRPPGPGEPQRRALRRRLLDWFDGQARALPWRGLHDPYAVLVSEVMLQQTQTDTVIPYFHRFLARFPDFESLAAAPLQEVLRLWEGLGYYRRARHLHALARQVVADHHGRLPDDLAALRALPGIGDYTAGAVLSIAFGRPAPLVDGNVERVLCRLFGLAGDPRRQPLRGRLWSLAEELVDRGRPGAFNQALMELGARICTPRSPSCAACPLASCCLARAQDRVDELPTARARPQPRRRTDVAAVVESESNWLFVQRPEGEVWAGLWELPRTTLLEGESEEDGVRRALREIVGLGGEPGACRAALRHGVTRWSVTLKAYQLKQWHGEPQALGCADWRWLDPGDLDRLPLSRPQRRLAERLRGTDGGQARPPLP